MVTEDREWIRPFESLSSEDVPQVGGKNASLGEMIQELRDQGLRVPGGFATTAWAYREYLSANELSHRIESLLDEWVPGDEDLQETGKRIRRAIRGGEFPEEIRDAILEAYYSLSSEYGAGKLSVAARSSATAEDLPEASFAGQQETFLNISGTDELLEACRKCYASLFTDRAISYLEEQGFDHMGVALSVGVQKMVRSDKAGAGVIFTIDTETGFPEVVVINAAWGLGENVVQGAVTPDEYRVFKPPLEEDMLKPIIRKELGQKARKNIFATGGSETVKEVDTPESQRRSFVLHDEEILQLGRWAVAIEDHYSRPMDIEWAKDGEDSQLYIVQARPETVQSQRKAALAELFDERNPAVKRTVRRLIGRAQGVGCKTGICGQAPSDYPDFAAFLVEAGIDSISLSPDSVIVVKRRVAHAEAEAQ
jgi:pyruvate,water dikinase